ncbi:cell surface protein [Bifidobacterium imperatoris]|uniref:Cell surface protein n=1 Tax=Bifidobacterium imperatoris TaxID=2020965 RepID=A0A2N5ISP5_9BIFI|nr:cell surface protein [Bifidobacterium imperatoris]PLS24947.1 cell surface protein [Bifidobacterium imperatoris]QSY58588.1 cell surface protein [Bifidobacterium imperatoris]
MAASWWKKRVIAFGAMLAGLAMMMGVIIGTPARAYAAIVLSPSRAHQRIDFTFDGNRLQLGVIANDADNTRYYCIEASLITDYVSGPTRVVDDDMEVRRMAWLLDRYRIASTNDYAAIASLIQDKFGNQEQWKPQRDYLVPLYPEVFARAQEMWSEAERNTQGNAVIESTYAEGLRQGTVTVAVVNGDERQPQPVAGVPFTITLEGPAVFEDNGLKTLSKTSTEQEQTYQWKATGRGEVRASVTYDIPRMRHMDARQDMRAFDSFSSVPGEAVTFKVRKDFTPSVHTQVSSKILDAGAAVFDEVTSAVVGSDSHWVPDLLLNAQGYYFAELGVDDLAHITAPQTGESADDYLARLKADGYAPVAYGSASFSGPNQSARVQAMTKPDGSKPYLTRAGGGFSTWVWVFRKSEQSKEAQDYLTGDWSSTFLEAEESGSNRSRLTVESTVTEHSAQIGAELSDTITVTGFPDDHGNFTGDEVFGFGADRPHAQVSVWWAGDSADQTQDEHYKPSGAAVPQEDEHHRKLITWDIPARNGTFKIGAGTLDANGDPMTITAQQHGWYVFVWEFKGDDRVMPATSRYDDAWERTRVTEPCDPEEPCEPDEPDEEEPEEPEEPVKPEEPETPLPYTGINMMPPLAVTATAILIGGVMLFIASRRHI